MDIEGRISKLERSNRVLKLSSLGSITVIACAFIVGQAKTESKKLVLNELVIQSEDGKSAVEIGPLAICFNRDNNISTMIHQFGIRMNVGSIVSTDIGCGYLSLSNASGKTTKTIYLNTYSNGGEIAFKTTDKDSNIDKTRMKLTYDIDDGSDISMTDQAGKYRIGLISTNKIGTNFMLLDDEGMARVVIGTNHLVDSKTGDEIKTSESSIRLFNNKGNVLWGAP